LGLARLWSPIGELRLGVVSSELGEV